MDENEWKELCLRALKKRLAIESFADGSFDNEMNLIKLEVGTTSVGETEFVGFFDRMHTISNNHSKKVDELDKIFDATLIDDVFYSIEKYVAQMILKKAFLDIKDADIESEVDWMLENRYFETHGVVMFNEKRYEITNALDWYRLLSEMYKAAL